MNYLKIEKVALKSIFRNKTRSFLTALGIIIGVCSVIVMVAIGQGSQLKIENEINSMGTNLLMVFPESNRAGGVHQGRGSMKSLTLDDCQKLKDQSEYLAYVSGNIRSGAQLIGGTGNWSANVEGVDVDYPFIMNWEIESGDFFSVKDVKSKKKVALIGKTIADELFADMEVIGQKLRVNNTPLTIVGVLKEKGENSRGDDQDDIVLAPLTTVLSRLEGKRKGNYVNMIYVGADTMENVDKAKEEITEILMQAHEIENEDDQDFIVRSQSEIVSFATSTTNTLTILLASIAGVSLLVGGIGIMNIMLVSVTERTREIGIRISIGARTKDVLLQFLAEAISLSFLGGILGILLAILISLGLNCFTELTLYINPVISIIAFAFSGTVGIFFGYYPAKKASELNPIDALHYE